MSNSLDSMLSGMRLDIIKSEINLLEKYLENMEGFLLVQKNSENDRLGKLAEERSQKVRDKINAGQKIGFTRADTSFEDNFGVEEWQFVDELSYTLRRSFFISLYAFIESKLDEECRQRKERRKESILLSLEDIKDNGVRRANVYWEKVLKLPFPTNSYWGDIHGGYRLLRNCIVHNNGNLNETFSPGFSDLKKFIQRKDCKNIKVLKNSRVILQKGFCEKAIKTTRHFFETLFASD